jgi:hypothetical protein
MAALSALAGSLLAGFIFFASGYCMGRADQARKQTLQLQALAAAIQARQR